MSLAATEFGAGARHNWDWKQQYVERFRNSEGAGADGEGKNMGDGLEFFSEASVTPDTTLILAGPPELKEGFVDLLSPIGLITDVNIQSDNALMPAFELGTDKTYFTRGKTTHVMSIGAMIANKPSLLKILSRHSPVPESDSEFPSGHNNHAGQFWMNLDTKNTILPFGILMIFKTKGSTAEPDSTVKSDFVSAVYLENCNFASFNFGINSQTPIVQENVSILFDRMRAVDYGEVS